MSAEPGFFPYESPTGMRWWIFDDGSILPCVSGGADGDGGGDGGGSEGGEGGGSGEGGNEGKPPAPKGEGPDGHFTQEQVNRMMAREKRDGKSSGVREVVEKMGFKDLAEAEAAIKGWRDAEEKRKTQAEREDEERERKNKEAETARAEAARERRIAKAERALVKAGVSSDKLDRAVRNLDLDFDKDIEDEDLTSAVEDLKKDLGSLFEDSTGNGSPPAPNPKPPGNKPPSDSKAKAAAQLDRMFPDRKKQTQS